MAKGADQPYGLNFTQGVNELTVPLISLPGGPGGPMLP